MDLKRLLSLTRKACDEYNLINEGDRIAVGISGGKDSLACLKALKELQRFYPKHFELEAITIDIGFGMDFSEISKFCDELGVRYTIVKTNIKEIVFNNRKEDNPCSLCAKMRKGALNDEIKRLNCNKVAYGHHKDDIIETYLLSLIFEGRFNTFKPLTYLDRTDLYVIRPLLLIDEADIIGFKNKYNLPVAKSLCPVDGYTKREYVKQLLKQLNTENKGVKERMFTAINNGLLLND